MMSYLMKFLFLHVLTYIFVFLHLYLCEDHIWRCLSGWSCNGWGISSTGIMNTSYIVLIAILFLSELVNFTLQILFHLNAFRIFILVTFENWNRCCATYLMLTCWDSDENEVLQFNFQIQWIYIENFFWWVCDLKRLI